MRIGVTGHRPKSISWGYEGPEWKALKEVFECEFQLATEVVSGMALGVDTVAAEVAIEMAIPLIAAVPFKGQEQRWPQKSQEKYWEILQKAQEIVIVSEGGYSQTKMMIRNEWIVNHSDLIVAVWNGSEGGTSHCVKYARKKKKDLIVISPKEIEEMVRQGRQR